MGIKERWELNKNLKNHILINDLKLIINVIDQDKNELIKKIER